MDLTSGLVFCLYVDFVVVVVVVVVVVEFLVAQPSWFGLYGE